MNSKIVVFHDKFDNVLVITGYLNMFNSMPECERVESAVE